MLANLLLWMGLKEKLTAREIQLPYFKEGELWWVHMGENIGVEINGKGETFTRPAFIYKKFNMHMLLVVPITSKTRKGTWYISFYHNNIRQIAVLTQIRIISTNRLYRKIGKISFKNTEKIKTGFKNLYL